MTVSENTFHLLIAVGASTKSISLDLFNSSFGPAFFSLEYIVSFIHRETAPSRSRGETQGVSSSRFYIFGQDPSLEGGN